MNCQISTSLRLLSPAVSQFPHILQSQKCYPQRNFFLSSKQLPLPLSIICHLPDETSPLLMFHFLTPLLFIRLFGPLFHFSPLWSFSSRLYHSLTFTPNRVLICFYYFFFLLLLRLGFYFYFFTFLLTCSVLGLMPHNPGFGKSEISE